MFNCIHRSKEWPNALGYHEDNMKMEISVNTDENQMFTFCMQGLCPRSRAIRKLGKDNQKRCVSNKCKQLGKQLSVGTLSTHHVSMDTARL